MKIVRLFILSLFLFACGDNKKKSADSSSFVTPQKKAINSNGWPDKYTLELHSKCLEGLRDSECVCLINAITSMPYSIYKSINMKDSARIELSFEEKQISDSVQLKWDDCFK